VRRAALALVAVTLAATASPARGATPATFTLRGDATHDNRVTGAPEPPLGVRWAVDLGADVSYPVIAEGSVFVTVRSPGTDYGTTAVALDLATGSVRWTRAVPGTYYWSALAYDQGRLHLLDYDGNLSALSPATGATLWSRKLSQYSFSTPPVGYDGHVYLTGAGSGTTVYAVRASDGSVAWQRPLVSGAGTPAVDAGGVYVSMVCQRAVALNRATGAVRWEHGSNCTGGGDSIAALHGGRMYPLGDDGAIYDAASGARVGEASFHGYVGFGEGTAYVPWLGGIRAVDAATWAQKWRLPGDGYDVGEAPLVAADHVYIGSEDGYVAALARSDGSVRWCASTAGIPVMGATGNVDRPDAGLGAGNGHLLVPAGRFLVAYGPGGAPPAPCDGTLGAAGGGTGAHGGGGATQGPSLNLRPDREDVVVGRRVELRGALAGAPAIAGVAVAVDADRWPFDGRWRRARSTTTRADGNFAVHVRPRRNTRYRALAAGLASPSAVVYADLVSRIRRSSFSGPTFREHWTIKAPRGSRRPARRAHFYVVRAGRRIARHEASARFRRVRPRTYAAAATLPWLRGPRRNTDVLACYRERTPDAWGRVDAIDPRCGEARLRVPERVRGTAATARFTAP
jgi:outer membrane protein assembly factor BamB